MKLESLLENARFLRAEIIYPFVIKEERMKRFWLVFLSLGLVMAFSASAFAVDVKVSGEFDVGGVYLNKVGLAKDSGSDISTAFYYQKLQLAPEFIVSPCLKLDTRFNVMERIWGGARTAAGTDVNASGTSAGTRGENENIAFDLAYVDYTSPIGEFKVGYQTDYVFGTVFGDRSSGPPAGQIQYSRPFGPVTLLVGYAKEVDNSSSAVTTGVTTTDRDYDSYRLAAVYTGKSFETGALLLYNRDASNKSNASDPYLMNAYNLVPYFKATIGPVALQGELNYGFGDAKKMEDNIPGENVSISTLSVFLDATANLGMAYVGGSFAWLSGDNPGTTNIEGGLGVNSAGLDWNPCLIMFNTLDTGYWVGGLYGNSGSVIDSEMTNTYFFQGRAGVKPIPQVDAMLSVSYATADQKPLNYQNGSYGWEIDATGTYKITNNLSYMLGIGYLFTGDYFKGVNNNNKTVDDYMLINRLTLSF